MGRRAPPPPSNVLFNTADARYYQTSPKVSDDNKVLTVILATNLCVVGNQTVQMVVTDRFGTSSIATLNIVDDDSPPPQPQPPTCP